MFKGLESHSTLYVLHHYAPLSTLNPLEVVRILKLRPRVPSLSVTLTPPPQFSRGTTPSKVPMFDSDSSPCPSPCPSPIPTLLKGVLPSTGSFPQYQPASLRPEQKRDISIFRSFCAVKSTLEAIWASVQIASGIHPSPESPRERKADEGERKMEEGSTRPKLPSKAARRLDLGSAPDTPVYEGFSGTCISDPVPLVRLSQEEKGVEVEGVPSSPADKLETKSLADAYQHYVLARLQEAKMFLSEVFPLNYRLEILENIFSLLFLTSDDVKQMKASDLVGTGATMSGPPWGWEEGRKPSPQHGDEFSNTLSSIALLRSKHGFFISEKMVSDILEMLSDCIVNLRAARYILTQGTASELSEETSVPPDAIKSSVTPTALQHRATKLEQCINEAKWRLQLVSAKYGVTAGGLPGRVEEEGWSSSEESGSEWSESEREEKEEEEEGGKREGGKREKRRAKRTHSDPHEPKAEKAEKPEKPDKSPELFLSLLGTKPPALMTQATLSGKISPILFHPNHPSPTPSPSLRQGATSVGSASRSPLPKRHSMRQNKSNSEPVQPVRPHDEDTAGWADDEELSPQLLKRQKRRRPRTHALAKKRCRKFSERQDSAHSKSSIVRRMLASPGSLLRMCLRHSNYLKADEVLKMFGMEGQFGEVFVRFLEQYETVSQELSQRSRSTSPKQSPFVSTPAVPSPRAGISQSLSLPSSLATLRSLTSSLGTPLSLQVAIVNATNSSVALESLHRLLAPSSINRMLFSGDELLEKAAKESHRLQVLSENVPTLVMLDIVCSSKVDGRVAKRVIELATERCQAAALAAPRSRGGGVSHHRRGSSERKWSQEVTLSGPLPLLLTLSDISGYFTSLSALPPSPGISSPPHTSPHTLLTAYAHQMKVSAIMNVRMFTESYRNARLRLAEQELLQTQKDCVGQRDILSEILQASESGGLAVQQPTSGSIFEELIRSLKSNPYYPSLPNSSRERSLMRHPSASSLVLDAGSGEVMTAYVPLVSRYLSKMADLLLSCLGGGGGGGGKGRSSGYPWLSCSSLFDPASSVRITCSVKHTVHTALGGFGRAGQTKVITERFSTRTRASDPFDKASK